MNTSLTLGLSGPLKRRTLTTSACPFAAALCSGVANGSLRAPASTRILTTSVCPFAAALCSGVLRRACIASTLSPSSISCFTKSASPSFAASYSRPESGCETSTAARGLAGSTSTLSTDSCGGVSGEEVAWGPLLQALIRGSVKESTAAKGRIC